MLSMLKTAVISVFVGVAVPLLASSESVGSEPTPAAVSFQARDLYIRNCARCHGSDGTGNTDLGRKFLVPNLREERKNLSNGKIGRVITNGKDDMPAFGKTLNKKQIAALTAFVRKL